MNNSRLRSLQTAIEATLAPVFDDDPVPEEEWDPVFVELRDAAHALDWDTLSKFLDLGAAWEEAVEILPKIRRFDKGERVPDQDIYEYWSLEVHRDGSDGRVHITAYDPTEDIDRRDWLGLTESGHGRSLTAALRMLVKNLKRRNREDSKTKTVSL